MTVAAVDPAVIFLANSSIIYNVIILILLDSFGVMLVDETKTSSNGYDWIDNVR